MNIKEYVPKSGLLFQEYSLYPVLCKPKLMPLKSVTLEKLEQMQKEAQEKVLQMEMQNEKGDGGHQQQQQQQIVDENSDTIPATAATGRDTENTGLNQAGGSTAQNVDVWRPEDDVDDQQDDSASAL